MCRVSARTISIALVAVDAAIVTTATARIATVLDAAATLSNPVEIASIERIMEIPILNVVAGPHDASKFNEMEPCQKQTQYHTGVVASN